MRADTRNLVRAVILHEPLALLGSIVSYGARQFITIDVFDPAKKLTHLVAIERVGPSRKLRDDPSPEACFNMLMN